LQNQNFVVGVLSQRFGKELQRVAARHGDGKTWTDMEGAATSARPKEGETTTQSLTVQTLSLPNPKLVKRSNGQTTKVLV
jgi:phosphoglycolate phosphatase-like HAD superfamily hydrolase